MRSRLVLHPSLIAFLSSSYLSFFLCCFVSHVGSSFFPTRAIPTWAIFRAPTSFVPSPHISTQEWVLRISMTFSLDFGQTLAMTFRWWTRDELLRAKCSRLTPSIPRLYLCSSFWMSISICFCSMSKNCILLFLYWMLTKGWWSILSS